LGQGDTHLRGSYFSCDYYDLFPESLKMRGFRTVQTGKRKQQLINSDNFVKKYFATQKNGLTNEEYRSFCNDEYRDFMFKWFESEGNRFYTDEFTVFDSRLNSVLREEFSTLLDILLNLGANLLGSRSAVPKKVKDLNIIQLRAISTSSVFRCLGIYPQVVNTFVHCLDNLNNHGKLHECQTLFKTNPLFRLYISQISEFIALCSKRSGLLLATKTKSFSGRDVFLHSIFFLQKAEDYIRHITGKSVEELLGRGTMKKVELEKEIQFLRLKMMLQLIEKQGVDVVTVLKGFEDMKKGKNPNEEVLTFLEVVVGMSSGFSFA
jgi:hypothetical protein